jgi:trans-aconitate methyltransferase
LRASLIYRNARLYELVMVALYGRHYGARYRAIANLIPRQATVLDVCCGPGTLYTRCLRHKAVQYTGLDINSKLASAITRHGGTAMTWDLRTNQPLPSAEYVVMQASLYHFLPEPAPVVRRMLAAASRRVLIAEPVRNLSASRSGLVSKMSRRMTNAGSGAEISRFSEETLDKFMQQFEGRVIDSFLLAGGREKLYSLKPDHAVADVATD